MRTLLVLDGVFAETRGALVLLARYRAGWSLCAGACRLRIATTPRGSELTAPARRGSRQTHRPGRGASACCTTVVSRVPTADRGGPRRPTIVGVYRLERALQHAITG